MQRTENNTNIGNYLRTKIQEKNMSFADFCRKWMTLEGLTNVNNELQRYRNRLSEILNGNNSIQIEYLPYFSEILGLTYEEILSAGKYNIEITGRLTNFSVAQSNNKNDWIRYLNDSEWLMCRPDERGKTFVDYAFEFENYKLIKFLINKEYIWFNGDNKKNYILNFDAGTSIKQNRREYSDDYYINVSIPAPTNCVNVPENYLIRIPFNYQKNFLNSFLEDDNYRIKAIILALDNNDYEMVSYLKSRELPSMYFSADYRSMTVPEDFEYTYNEKLVKKISNSGNEIIKYFTSEFTIIDSNNIDKSFMFPYISHLLDALLLNVKCKYTEEALKRSIEHGKKMYKIMLQTMENAKENTIKKSAKNDFISIRKMSEKIEIDKKKGYNTTQYEEILNKYISQRKDELLREAFWYNFNENGNVLAFRCVSSDDKFGLVTNIAHVSVSSKSEKLNELINELNELYNKIKSFKEDMERELKEWFVKTAEKN